MWGGRRYLRNRSEQTSMSASSRLRVAAWTLLGTLGCVCVAVGYNWFAFRSFGADALRQSIISAIVLPIALGVPVFSYLNFKLRELAIANRRLSDLASRDSLTDCLSRSAFSALMETRLAAARRQGERQGGGLLVVDVDHFKVINDRFGHDRGDEALRLIAQAMRSVLRGDDAIGRLGGEEFGIHLPGVSGATMAFIAERVRAAVAGVKFEPDGARYDVSVSIGCAVHDGRSDFPQLFRLADQNLFKAKRGGRNRVRLDSTPSLAPSLSDLAQAG